jgi:hypothetical protein
VSARVLTTAATIQCPHGGIGTTTPASQAWTVNGANVVRAADTGTLTCAYIVPCSGYLLRSMGLNATLLEGLPVILETDVQQSLTGLPLQISDSHTTYDDSTLAPLPPPGSGLPPPAPDLALADVAPPVVTVAPPTAPFSVSLQTPQPAVFTFTLVAPFPLSWSLTLLNTVAKVSVPLTDGLPPGAVVAPPGGRWDASPAVVVLTLVGPFMAALGPGTHDLYLTGVTRRGLSAAAHATVVVSP